jgi:hypothetical protein
MIEATAMGSAAHPVARDRRWRAFDALWLAFWIAASSAWCVSAAGELSATFDEPLYIARGLDGWRTGSHAGLLRKGTMPLPADLQTLPLFAYESWRGVAFDARTDLRAMLPWARAVTLIFWATLLIYGWLTARALTGAWGGRIAVALLACEPSLLAHAGLATTDVALAACTLALLYHFRVARAAGWTRRVGLPTLWFAAALLSKASALVLGPLCLVLLELERVWSARRPAGDRPMSPDPAPRPLRGAAIDVASIIGGGVLLAFLYCGSDWRADASFVAWAHALPADSVLRSPTVWLAEQLRIFSNAGEALVRQVRHNIRGHGAYLLGATHPRALWYYFPLLLTIKLSEPVLLAALAVVLIRRGRRNWALLLAAALVLYSLTFRVQLGVRMVLPIVVLLIVGSAAALAAMLGSARGWPRAALGLAAVAALVWNVNNALAAWPHGLAYVNRFWGGTAGGYRLVSDSNYDWGQGLFELRSWQARRGNGSLDVWYFGTDPLVHEPPLRLAALHTLGIGSREDMLGAVRGHVLAVSTTLLHGAALHGDAYEHALAVLRERAPIDRTTTFLIYDFTAG